MSHSPLYRPRALTALIFVVLFYALLGGVALFCLTGCQSPTVTNNGTTITDKALVTAVQTVHVAEMAMVTITDALTSAYQSGQVGLATLEMYQANYAPKVKAALATAKIALQAWASAPGQTAEATAVQALGALAGELETLQGFWKTQRLVPGGTP